MNCGQCEELMSDYIDSALKPSERDVFAMHLRSCRPCTELFASMKEVIAWGRDFPVYKAPSWLPARIVANTPVVARERWIDTLASIGRWIIEPRTALVIFTSALVVGWLGGAAGISPDWREVVRDPRVVYYEVVRAAYRSPLVTEIESRIEQLMEIS
jgi:anti-sigma factor RsiW